MKVAVPSPWQSPFASFSPSYDTMTTYGGTSVDKISSKPGAGSCCSLTGNEPIGKSGCCHWEGGARPLLGCRRTDMAAASSTGLSPAAAR